MKKKVFSLMMTLVLAFMGIARVEAQVQEFLTVNFEDQTIPAGWTNDATYPWTVVLDANTNSYCMTSTNSGVASSTSAIEATYDFPEAGSITFDGGCWGEGTSTIWDKCLFYIDGTQKISNGALQSWNTYTFNVTAGSHTFMWAYQKDGSVNPTGDYFRVDNIVLAIGDDGGESGPTLTLHDATTTNSYVPVWGLWTDNSLKHEMVYPASELSSLNGMYITNMKFYSSNSFVSWNGTFEVFVKEISATTLTDFTGMAGATTVYQGSLGINSGEMEIAFDYPYPYSGGNLLIGVYYTSTTGYSSCSWYGESVNGASVYARSGNGYAVNSANFLPKVTFTYSENGGGAAGLAVHLMHNGVMDTIDLGTRPGYMVSSNYPLTNGLNYEGPAWMQPVEVKLYNEAYRDYRVLLLDYSPNDSIFFYDYEVPFVLHAHAADTAFVPMWLSATRAVTGTTVERQFVAIYENNTRMAAVWPITTEVYIPRCPDIWELALNWAPTSPADTINYPYSELSMEGEDLHNDYTLPFPEIPEGYDAVYKLTIEDDQMLTAYVIGNDGKVALYAEDFNSGLPHDEVPGHTGPMIDNNYGMQFNSSIAAPFEATIGDESSTTTFSYFPYYQYYYNSIGEALYIASELEAAGVTTAPMTSLSWYANSNASYEAHGIQIWMANVTETELTTTSHNTSGMTLVYSGNMTPVAGWNEFVFNQGTFAWDGQSNILICTLRNDPEWHSGPAWKAENASFTASAYNYNDYTVYNSTTDTYTLSTSQSRSIIKMKADGSRNRDELTYSFDSGLEGWTTIDADGDGLAWTSSMTPGIYHNSGVDLTGTGHNASAHYAISGSYANATAQVLYPDNYFVSPQIALGGSFSFYACAQDANYAAEHFAVAVSTTSNTNASAFTNLQEWTMTAKGSGVPTEATRSGNRVQGNWYQFTVDLSAYSGMGYVAIRHFNCYDQFILNVDDVTISTNGSGMPTPPVSPFASMYNISAGPDVLNLPLAGGNNYYLVASSTDKHFGVVIKTEDMPCPHVAMSPVPADGATGLEPDNVTLQWTLDPYTTGWRLVVGTTYFPDSNHPQTFMYPEDGSYTTELATSFPLSELYQLQTNIPIWNNTQYFWRIDQINGNCAVQGETWGFTTHLNVPDNLRIYDPVHDTLLVSHGIFEEDSLILTWRAIEDRTYRNYYIYKDGEYFGQTATNQINATTFVVPAGTLAYNMNGYTFYVTAVYDEGESAPSDPVNVKVSGRGTVSGYVYEQDGETPITGAMVTFVGPNEFGDTVTFNFWTGPNGYYEGTMYAGSYDGEASMMGYQTATEPTCGEPVDITYNTITPNVNFILDENFDPVCCVLAEYYPVVEEDLEYVKVSWGCGMPIPGASIVEDFETGDFSQYEWQLDPVYPWVITTENPYEGLYCMKSGNQQVLSSTSTMSVTVEIPNDGVMSFFGKISCESNYDYGYFYIDGVQKAQFTGTRDWTEKVYDITAGEHTFTWEYTEDYMISSGDDCFYVDYISFCRQPDPLPEGNFYTFDNGFQGWTNIDADGDGHVWYHSSDAGNHGTSAIESYSGDGHLMGESYCNAGGALTPDDYLVSPQMYPIVNGTTISFWACAQDDWYPAEHFGVAVSTASNTNPADFTTIQEWTLTAKRGGRPTAKGRENRASTAGDWYQFTADLSAYAGQNAWLAIRHFNCTDQFIICLDDLLISDGSKRVEPNRSFHHYRVYRTNCYNDGPYTLENTMVLACEVTDTVYIDTYWADPEVTPPGVYKWGVGVVYQGNRGEEVAGPITWTDPVAVEPEQPTRSEVITIGEGTSTTYQFPVNSLYKFSFTEMIYTADEIGTAGTISSVAFHFNGNNELNRSVSMYMKNVSRNSFESSNDYESVTAEDLVYTGTLESAAADGWVTLTLDTPFVYDGTSNLMVAFDDNTGSWSSRYFYYTSASNTGLCYYSDSYNPDPYNIGSFSGSKTVSSNRPNIQLDITPGTAGNGLQEPRESEIVWSNECTGMCLDKDMYLYGVSVNVLLNSADSPEGTVVTFTNCNDYEQQVYPVEDLVLDASGYYAFEAFRRGNYKISVTHYGYEPIYDSVGIWEPTELRYVMTEILAAARNLYVSRTGWAMWDEPDPFNPSGDNPDVPAGGGDTFTEGFENGIPAGWTLIDGGTPAGYGWQLASTKMTSPADYAHTGSDFMLSQSYQNGLGSITPDNYLITPQVNLGGSSVLSFWACAQDNGDTAEHFGVAVSTTGTNASDFTMVQEWTIGRGEGISGKEIRGDRQTAWQQYTCDLSAYAGQQVYLAIRHFNCSNQFYLDVDDIELSNGGRSADRHFEYYKVMCTSIDGVPIFNHNTVWPFCQLSTNEPYNAPLIEGEHYLCKIAAVYSTGQSAWCAPVEWEYEPCDHWGPVDEVTTGVVSEGNHIEWVFEHGYNPYAPGDEPTPPTPGETLYYDFESGDLGNWTLVDADNDGDTWQIGTPAEYGIGNAHSGDYCATSWSWNGYSMDPDNWMISPEVVGATSISYYVATNTGYPDHYAIMASSTGTNTSDFTMVFEEDAPVAKGAAAGVKSSIAGGGHREMSPWTARTIQLPAGTKYVAFRHYNSYDMNYLFIDDVTISTGAKTVQSFDKGGEFYTQYAEDGILLNFFAMDNVYFRTYVLYNLTKDARFTLMAENEYGKFIVNPAYEMSNFKEEFEDFYRNATSDFFLMSKVDVTENMSEWKSGIAPAYYLSIMMDVYSITSRADNDHCLNSLPFCTSEVIEFPAAHDGGATADENAEFGCVLSQPYPSWYHMRIQTAGQFVIHMEAHDPDNPSSNRDIDYCLWGPFDDPYTPCLNDLTCDKIIDCSYSTASIEDAYLGYPQSQHDHGGSSLADGSCINYHVPEVGEYYILMITNYSQQQCNISFTKTEGVGETDCNIVDPDYDVIGFLITQDGEYLAIVGPEVREYTDVDEFGEHVYCVRPIYPGQMFLPDHNYGWSMGCPVCESTTGDCAPGEAIHGEALNATDQIKVWWGEQNPGPGPGGCEGDEFTLNFDNSQMPAGWTTNDADGDGYNWILGSACDGIYLNGGNLTGAGHNSSNDLIVSGSYSNVVGALTPDNWLISPAVTLCEGSTFSFWACGQDASYVAEHFGVAISDDGVNFGMVQEWTMTAKDNGMMSIGRNGQTRAQGNWHQYTVNLGDYAGEGRYIAIRHFNCTDMFILDVDDIELTAGAKNRAGIENYIVYRSTDNVNYTQIAEVPYVAGQTYYEYIDTPASAGAYYYQVRADYGDCLSEPAQAFDNPSQNYVMVEVTSIDENNGGVALYPNPTNGNVKIEAKDMTHITVVSVLGQVLYDADIDADEYELNMGQYNAGVYMVRIATENGVSTQRVTVVK